MYDYPDTGLNHEQKVQRLQFVQVDLTSTAAALFSSNVGTGKRRYICGCLIANNDASPQAVTLQRLLADGSTLQDLIDSLDIDARGSFNAKPATLVDVDNPIWVLEPSQNIKAAMDTSGKTGQLTIWWYDDPL